MQRFYARAGSLNDSAASATGPPLGGTQVINLILRRQDFFIETMMFRNEPYL